MPGPGDPQAIPGGCERTENSDQFSSKKTEKCAVDSRGRQRGKLDIKGCFQKSFGCQETAAEGTQSNNATLGRPESSAAPLTAGAAKARTHNGEQGFYFVILKEGCLQATQGREERLDCALCVGFHQCFIVESLAALSISSL